MEQVSSKRKNQQNNKAIQKKLIQEYEQLQNQQSIIKHFMRYEYPDSQKYIKNFWADLIQTVIRKKKQIYITYQDLYQITYINKIKPLPIEGVLNELRKQSMFLKEEDFAVQQKTNNQSSWINNALNFAWFRKKQDGFTFSPEQKIFSKSEKNKKKSELIECLREDFERDNYKVENQYIRQLAGNLNINEQSVKYIILELTINKEIIPINIAERRCNLIVFSLDKSKLRNPSYINLQRIIYLLKMAKNNFEKKLEKSTEIISKKKNEAKEALLRDDRFHAKLIVATVANEQKHRKSIHYRHLLLEQKIHDFEINEMNSISVQILEEAQHAYEQVEVDQRKFQKIIQKSRQNQQKMLEQNKSLQDFINQQQINQEVDSMMQQLQNQIKSQKGRKQQASSKKSQKKVDKKSIKVQDGPQLMQIEQKDI